MIREHRSLDEARKAGYISHRLGDHGVSNEYRKWCNENLKPIVTITFKTPEQEFLDVDLNLSKNSVVGFSAKVGREILHELLKYSLKPRSTLTFSPIHIRACVDAQFAEVFASFLYHSAVDERVVLTQKELIQSDAIRRISGGSMEYAFPPTGIVMESGVQEAMRAAILVFHLENSRGQME